jgi:hypothetical protein
LGLPLLKALAGAVNKCGRRSLFGRREVDLPRPDPAGPDEEKNAYVLKRAVPFPKLDRPTVEWIDFSKRDRFVQETKHGSYKAAELEAFALSR